MARYKIVQDRSICIGDGSCANVCPEFWEMADDGRSTLKGSKKVEVEKYELELEDIACNQEAADLCPVNCIHIYKDGKLII